MPPLFSLGLPPHAGMKKGLCKHCAPDLGVEMSAAQSSRSVEEIWRHAAMSAEDKLSAGGGVKLL